MDTKLVFIMVLIKALLILIDLVQNQLFLRIGQFGPEMDQPFPSFWFKKAKPAKPRIKESLVFPQKARLFTISGFS